MNAFTLQRIAGHASITTTQRYVRPNAKAMEQAMLPLDAVNRGKTAALVDAPAAVPATMALPEASGGDGKALHNSGNTLAISELSECAPVAQVDRATVS